MSMFGSIGAQGVAGAGAAERLARESAPRPATKREVRKAIRDEVEVHSVEAAEAVRSLAGNDQEEAREDRQSHDHYAPAPPPPSRRLDVEG